MQASPLLKDLVLVGGGHTHVHVLKSFGLKPMPGVRLTLIGRDVETPYSGMIPGFVAGRYSFDECHIDLAWLCASTGARLVRGEATGIDRARRQVLLKDGPAVSYDLLSIDVGSAPNLETIPGAREWATPVKPIAELARHWTDFLERMKTWLGPLDVTVIGGGAGGVELALAIDHRLRVVAKGAEVQVTLVTKDEILAGQAAAARRRMRAIFQRRGLRLLEKAATVRIERGAVQLESGKWLHADAVFVVTEASAAPWFAETGLPLDQRGFLAVAGHAALDGRRARLRRGRLLDSAEASPAQGRRIRGAPRTAACGEPAACPAGPRARTVRAADPLSLDHRHRRRPRHGDARRVGDRGRLGVALEGSRRSQVDSTLSASRVTTRDATCCMLRSGTFRTGKRESGMAKNTIVDTVTDAVIGAEVAVVKAGREAVKAVQSGVKAGARRIASKKKAAKKVVKKAAKKAKKAVSKTKRAVKKVAKKAAKRAKRR